MAIVRQEFRRIRTIDLASGFAEDPDWVADFDAPGARSVSAIMVPRISGVLEVVCGFEDADGGAVAPDLGTAMGLDLIFLEPDPGPRLYRFAYRANIPAIGVFSPDRPLGGPTSMAIRVWQLASPPRGASVLHIDARVG